MMSQTARKHPQAARDIETLEEYSAEVKYIVISPATTTSGAHNPI